MVRVFILLKLLFLITFVYAQNNSKVQGWVVNNENGNAIIGATIISDKLANQERKITDRSGRFEIKNLDFPAILKVSCVGYQDTSIIIDRAPLSSITIRLSSSNHVLEEVFVSTGIQRISKERASGSFDYIDSALFNRQISTDVLSRLDGISSSVLFDNRALGGTREVSIRGLSTIFSNREPLIILNDFPYEGDINNINPDDVEDITVLKDATAASIWGVRAGNGVIVITTKKAKINQPVSTTFSANTTLVQSPNMLKLPQMSSVDFIGVEKMLFANDYFKSKEQLGYSPLTPAVELMYKNSNGLISDSDLEQRLSELAKYDIREQLNKYVYKDGLNQQYSLNLKGRSEIINYYLSSGYDNNVNTTGRGFKRYSIRSDNTMEISSKLSINASLFYIQTNTDAGRATNFNMLYPYAQFADDYGNPLSIDRYYRSSYLEKKHDEGFLDWKYRPLDEINLVDNSSRNNNLILNGSVFYKFNDNLRATLKYQFENTQGIGKDIQSSSSYYTRDLINTYTQFEDDGSVSYPVPLGDILNESNTSYVSQTLRAQFDYNKEWGKHQVSSLAGIEVRKANSNSRRSLQYGYNPTLLTTLSVNYDVEYPLNKPNGGSSNIPYLYSLSEKNDRFISFYTNWAYTFDNRLNLNLSARQDGSNLFGVKSHQKFTPLWSIGSSWIISNEKFFNLSWLNHLKLRTTFGFSGNLNRDVSALPTIRYFNVSGGNLINTPYANIVNPPNENLRWEKNGQFNVGVDFSALKNRINGSFEYYYKINKDLIGYMPIDQTTGAVNVISTKGFSHLGNSASLVGGGIDLRLNSLNTTGALKWTSDFIYSIAKSKVKEYLVETNNIEDYLVGGQVISPLIGKPPYSIFAFKWAGLDPENGDPLGYLDGEVTKDYIAIRNQTTPEELKYFGSALPTHFGSFRNTFSWQRISLSFNISYKFGFYFIRNSVNYGAVFNGTVFHSDFDLRWKQPGDELNTSVPSMVYPSNSSRDGYFYPRAEVLVSKGDNIRVQDVNLSYQMKFAENKMNFKKLDLIFYATNLGTVWKASKYKTDPEFGDLSPLKTYSIGLRATF